MVTVLLPALHVADVPFSIAVPFTSMSTMSSAVAVILFVALLVAAVYSVTSGSKLGVRVREPMVRAERVASSSPPPAVIPPRR